MNEKKQNLQSLIRAHSRRLQKLNEQKAWHGLDTPPAVQIEIEDIETELERLQVNLDAFTAPLNSQHSESPVVHIHNWGAPPMQPPDTAVTFNWLSPGKFEEFTDRTRSAPDPKIWESELLPQLRSLPGGKTCSQGWVGLEGKCALSTGFAFGTVFRAKERYQIEVAQFVPDKGHTEYWTSNAQPPENVPAPSFSLHIAEREGDRTNQSPVAKDAVIVVSALNNKTIYEILDNVGTYFGEAEAFSQIPDHPKKIQAVKAVLALEATAATRDKRVLEGWEAAGLARSSTQLVNNFKHRVKPKKLHLFFAGPLGLAVFMGHYWTNVHKTVQCYEEVRTEKIYAPSCEIRLN